MNVWVNMNVLIYYAVAISFITVNGMSHASEKNLLQDGFAAVAVSTDNIEAIYLQAIEKDYDLYTQLGADWDDEGDGRGKEKMLAGMQVVGESKILFIAHDSFNISEIAFENIRPSNHFKLSRSDIAEINEAIIVSHIKARSVDPKTFNINLD